MIKNIQFKYLGRDSSIWILLMFDFFHDNRGKKVGFFLELFSHRWELTWGEKNLFDNVA